MISIDYFQDLTKEKSNQPTKGRSAVFLSPLLNSCALDLTVAALTIAVGTGFAVLILTFATNQQGVSAASAAGAALIYLASLSGANTLRSSLAMIIPALSVWALLAAANQQPVFLGFALLLHCATSFYGTLGQPKGALTEMRLWPLLLGFHGTLLAAWIAFIA